MRGGNTPKSRPIYLVASGDARGSANTAGWAAQKKLEENLLKAAADLGATIQRAHPFRPDVGHGFIDSQRMGMDVFNRLNPDAPVIVAEAIWQFSHHVLAGLLHHRGQILTVANWSGQWPGLVGLLNLNASLSKAGRSYASLWSKSFDDDFFLSGFDSWLETGETRHDLSHVTHFTGTDHYGAEERGNRLAREMIRAKAIIGVIDEGCMGMFNAILDDYLLHDIGVFKERLSQSALVAEMGRVSVDEVGAARRWLDSRGFIFITGDNEKTDLTETQIEQQLSMYIAAGRMAERYDCDAIGIQYQLGLTDVVPASDLAEGLLNNADRPPITTAEGSAVIREGAPIPHFNEVDEGVAVDLLVTNRVWTDMGLDPSATLHDVRWGEPYDLPGGQQFVWTFMISGSVPASHLEGGYAGGRSYRQPVTYFPRGGGTLSGVSRPGPVVWSRVYQIRDRLHVDIGRADAVSLPEEETTRRLNATTPEWPIMHAVLHGVTRDQFMAQHKSNHVTVAYTDSDQQADEAMLSKAVMFRELGVEVHLCGVDPKTDG